jgi:hypothetical protein
MAERKRVTEGTQAEQIDTYGAHKNHRQHEKARQRHDNETSKSYSNLTLYFKITLREKLRGM